MQLLQSRSSIKIMIIRISQEGNLIIVCQKHMKMLNWQVEKEPFFH